MSEIVHIERFASLFAGLTRAKGRYVSTTDPSKLVVGDKAKGKATTITEQVTFEDYRRHVLGEISLGVVPVRDDGTCVFGAIDVDQYTGLDHAAIVRRLAELNINAYVCRSKSGGAHIYTFVHEPGCAAQAMIAYLKKLRTDLGIDYRKAREIFPKQVKQSGGIGNWINLPYFGDTPRRAVKIDGTDYTFQEFVESAVRLDAAKISQAPTSDENLVVTELPPCLERLIQDGIPAGQRNEALFNFTVFAAKKHQLDRPKTIKMLDVINMRVCQPPVPSQELKTTLNSVLQHEYNYRCQQSPLVDCCDKAVCATRPYGPSASMRPGNIPEIERIEIRGDSEEETRYHVKLANVPTTVTCDSSSLLDYTVFRKRVMDKAHTLLSGDVKKKDWDAYITARFAALAETVRVAPEGSKLGMLQTILDDWIQTYFTTDPEQFRLGRPYVENGAVFVKLGDVGPRLKKSDNKLGLQQIVVFLENSGWEKVTKTVDGRAYDNVWTKTSPGTDLANEQKVVVIESTSGEVVLETPKDVPASTFEEYDSWDRFKSDAD
jgi:hypothetical protein